MSTTELGNKFEKHALDYLLKHHAELIAKQYRSRYGEIDLIVHINHTIIFVEVRARKNNNYGGAIYSITKSKQQKIILTAQAFMQNIQELNLKLNLSALSYRFDAIIFDKGKIEWLQNCIEAD